MNTFNEQEAAHSAQSTTVVEKESRQSLIDKFDDLKTPTGDDFEAMIRSGFNQVDDPIQVVEVDGQSELDISAPVTVRSDIHTDEQLNLSADELSMTNGQAQTLNLNSDSMQVFDGVFLLSKTDEKLQIAGTVQANTLNATEQVDTAQLNADALLVKNSDAEILRAELDENNNPKVTVSGEAHLAQSLYVTDTTNTAHLAASASSTLANASANTLVVAGTATLNGMLAGQNAVFTEHVEARDTLGVGIDAQSTQAKLHISKSSSDMDALLRVDDYNNDTTPFFINSEGKVGVGTTEVAASFHVADDALFGDIQDAHYVKLNGQDKSHFAGNVSVSESMAIGGETLPSVDKSLAVEGNLAIGKTNASAKLDVQGSVNTSLLNVGTSAAQFIKISDAPLQNESKVTVYQKTSIKDDLHVESDITATNVTTSNHVSANSATITQDLVAGATTVSDLTVNTHATIAQKTTTNKLWVGDTQTGITEQDTAAGALLNTTLTVKGSAQFTDITASADISTDTALHGQSAHISQGVNIGEQSTIPSGKLVIKTATEEESALLIKDYEENPLLRVKKQSVQVGSEMAPVPVNVKGTVTAPNVEITQQANIGSAQVYSQLNIASNNEQPNWESNAKLAVLSNPSNASGVEISHFNGQAVTPIITSKMDKLGLFEANPIKPLHVGADTLFASSVDFASDMNVLNNNGEAIFSVNDMNVTVGSSNFATPFNVHGDADIFGNTDVHGQLTVSIDGNPLLSTTNSQVNITQLGEQAAVKVQRGTTNSATYIAAGQLAINQPLPESDVNFALTGQACVAGQVQIMGEEFVGEEFALEVQGDTKLSKKLTVAGAGQIDDGLSISVTNNSAQLPKDALFVQGSSNLSGTLSVTDTVDFYNNLTVTDGIATFTGPLNANGSTTVDNTLTVNGRASAMGGLIVAQTETDNALLVEGLAQFDTHVEIDGDLNLSDKPAQARVHIQEQGKRGLYIERQGGQTGLVFNDGRLGVGVERPDYALDVAEDSQFRKDVEIKGRLEIDESLHVDEYASFRSNINVHGNSELAGEARFGLPFSSVSDEAPIGMPAGIAQVAIDQNHFAKAFAVYHQGEKPVVIEDGKLGVQTDSPREALDVAGNALIQGDIILNGKLRGSGRVECFDGAKIFGDVELRSDLTVNDDVHLKDTLLVEGQATFNRHVEVKSDSTFQDSVRLNDELSVHKHTSLRDTLTVAKQTTLQGGLNIEGLEVGSQVTITPASTFNNAVTVHGQVNLHSPLHTESNIAAPSLSVSGEHVIHVESNTASAPLSIQANSTDALHITPEGHVGVGTQTPECKLDIEGDVRVRNTLTIDSGLTFAEDASIQSDCKVSGAFSATTMQLGDTQLVGSISTDVELGGEMSSNEVLATQAAIKAYVDAHCWSWTESNKVLLIQNQQEFDDVMSREILCNVTILLLPHTSHPQMNRAYKLKQQVRIGSNVSIIGFNERETRIVKEHAGCRFLIHGQSDAMVKSVEMRGFTFDGSLLNGGLFEGNGGAFHLRYVQSAKLNCVIENHHVSGDGGAIYGESEVSAVEAGNIKHCSATRQGGGVFGVKESTLNVSLCRAESGAGVAYCDDSQVVARTNTAVLYGGGAYKCQNLMAQGYWRGNRAESEVGHHIYSAGCDTSHDEHTHQDYWWHGLYIDGPVMCGAQPWRNDHI
ncbi:hypothetical protein PSECIP111854_01611 [Pseudoalteromonas sp. CIP111854]|uniref:Uncharacterized protein n=1 Tax=Pseudoalteromonas holothuriae TaxID=2963714 RepID=A0A9W4QVK2_9GAMM|nr:hypothetical protein [Pseudoalteromonas sp. CIP111854]CAH9055603.1 hypothetical protein PSECIP111854_01611 [Pseudoalteromonas sp. CIP111854]